MPAFPNDRSNDPKAAITYGFDYNFFAQVTPGSSGAGVFATDCDVVINMKAPTYNVTFWAPSGTSVQYSFNGNTIHGTLDGSGTVAPQFLEFDNRVISKIWFTYIGGSGKVRVEAWAIR
jgi:hypothetical protein